eukprot:3160841-Alexandrium_andersonii.AAC.1
MGRPGRCLPKGALLFQRFRSSSNLTARALALAETAESAMGTPPTMAGAGMSGTAALGGRNE